MNTEHYIDRWFWVFLLTYVLLWTLAPILARHTLPLDAVEGATWGHAMALGYDKNPWVNAWLTEFAVRLGGRSGWMTYFFSQLSVALCFWSVWRLGKKILSPAHAFIAVVLLGFVISYNVDAIDLNDNVLELSTWGLTILCFYNALLNQKVRYWTLCGFFAALALMTKYFAVILFIPMFGFMLLTAQGRRSFTKASFYCGSVVFLLVVLPHFIWLFWHDFITVNYAFARTGTKIKLLTNFMPAWIFFKTIILDCILPLLIFSSFYWGKNKGEVICSKEQHVSGYNKLFFLLLGFGPTIVVLLYSAITGAGLHTGWRTPMLFLWGILLLLWLQPCITVAKFKRFLSIIFALLFISVSMYTISIIRSGHTSSANYPGAELATKITNMWHAKYKTKLKYIVGTRWASGVASLYSKDRPYVYIDADNKVSFWIDKADLRAKGAVFVWDLKEGGGPIPQKILARFKNIQDRQIINLNWYRDKNHRPVRFEIAFLPPVNQVAQK
jgi:4-amino-4-deoxy-L-arabinose transferase-like glycosyltransferase